MTGHGRSKKGRTAGTKAAVFAAAFLLLLFASVFAAVAFIAARTQQVTNTFTAAGVSCEVQESFNAAHTEKSDVKVKNTGDTDAYIRAAVIISWQDAEGNVYGRLPAEGTDYSITYGTSGWVLKDGYYYYNTKLAPGASTAMLIRSCTLSPAASAPSGYKLSVDILAQAIQAEPAEAVHEAWGIAVNSDGTLNL